MPYSLIKSTLQISKYRRDQLDATISDFIVNQLFLNMFRASLRPSSGGQTAFHCLWFSVLLWLLWCWRVHIACISTLQHHNSYNRTENHMQWNAVWPPVDGRKDARNMLRNNWLTIKSLNIASSWSLLYLLIKDARSFKHKVHCIQI